MDGTEQRWQSDPILVRFLLEYRNINRADRASLDAFASSTKGAFDSTWQLVLGSQTYTTLAFEEDGFTWTENPRKPLQFSGSIAIRQVVTGGEIAASGASDYPTFADGTTSGLPYVRIARHFTLRNDLQSGPRYAWAFYGGGLTGYPTENLRAWKLTYSCMSDVDLATLEGHFLTQAGRMKSFAFTDPDNGEAYSNVRYDSDALEIRYLQRNCSFVQVSLIQTNA